MDNSDETKRPQRPRKPRSPRAPRPGIPNLPPLPSLDEVLGTRLPPGVAKALDSLADQILNNLAKDILREDIAEAKERASLAALQGVADNWWHYLMLKGCSPVGASDTHPACMVDKDDHPMLFAGVGGRLDREDPDVGAYEAIPFFFLAVYDQECIDAAKRTLIEIYERRNAGGGRTSPAAPDAFFESLERQMKDMDKEDEGNG